jgi:hypothetical protein
VDADGDPAVGLLAPRAAVRALDADGATPLFGEGDVVEDDDPLRAGGGRGEEGAVASENPSLVPGTGADERLESRIGVADGQARGKFDASGEGFDALRYYAVAGSGSRI